MAWMKTIALLTGTGLVGGALLAGMTTRSIAPSSATAYHVPDAAPTEQTDQPPSSTAENPSWLERGFAAIDGPAWPFGRHQWEGQDEEWQDGDTGYADDDSYDDDGEDDEDGGSYAASQDHGRDGDSPGDQVASADTAHGAISPTGDGERATIDAPADAARRAAKAAQDVVAAEHAH